MRTLQMFNSLGMSESILLLIERRSRADMFIFVAMAIGTLVFLFVLYYYVKPFQSWLFAF
jgi:hypothetical protein